MVGVMGGWLTDGAQEVSVCGKSQGRQEFLTGSGPENGGENLLSKANSQHG